jgi:hypothetical protein
MLYQASDLPKNNTCIREATMVSEMSTNYYAVIFRAIASHADVRPISGLCTFQPS